MSFVQPETILEEDVTELKGDIFQYVTDTEGMSIILSDDTPAGMLPKVGDKLVTLELSTLFPCGFLGQVAAVEQTGSGYRLTCDSLAIEDAVERFYGIYKLSNNTNSVQSAKRKAAGNLYDDSAHTGPLQIDDITIPFSGILNNLFKVEDIGDLNGKLEGEIVIKPVIDIDLTIAIDKTLLLSKVNIHAETDFQVLENAELVGQLENNLLKIPLAS